MSKDKTPEQMAEEWALSTFKEPYSELIGEDQYAYSVAVDAFLAGYESRDKEVAELQANWTFCCEDKARLLKELAAEKDLEASYQQGYLDGVADTQARAVKEDK